jgi:hypothetical protein
MEKQISNRVRLGVGQTAKGLAQMDITVEFATVDEVGKALDGAIKEWRKVVKTNGLTEAGQE